VLVVFRAGVRGPQWQPVPLTTQAVVVEKKEGEKHAPAMPGGGGMGGMY
jgi:hypothetical protein